MRSAGRTPTLATLVALAACTAPAADDAPEGPVSVGPEHGQVLATVDAVLTAISTGDAPLLRRMMVPEARIVAVRPGQPPAASTVDDMAGVLADPPRRFTERMWDPQVRVDGPIASVWTPYDFYLGDEFSHCGVDTFQLVLVDGQWRVLSLAYNTLQPPDCRLHPNGPPGA